MGTHGLQLPPPAIHSYVWKRRYRRLKSEVLSATTAEDAYCDDADFYRELGERGWQRLAVVDMGG